MRIIKLLLLMFTFILLSSFINAEWCYQETATTSTTCGGVHTGNYDVSSTANWYYINYTKPFFSTQDSKWLVKHNQTTYNATIPLECWNAYTDKILLGMYSRSTVGQCRSYPACYNGTGWEQIGNDYNIAAGCTPSHGGSFSGSDLYNELWSEAVAPLVYYTQVGGTNEWVWALNSDARTASIAEEAMYWNILGSPIGVCNTSLNKSIYSIDIKNENNNTDVYSEVNSYIEVYYTSNGTTFNKSNSFNLTRVKDYNVCIYPYHPNLTIHTHIRHENTSYRTESYIQRYLSFNEDSTGTNKTVWMLKDNDLDYDILRSVKDLTDLYYRNYLIEAYKYDVLNNSARLVETKLTDWNGQAVLVLDIIDEFYIFRIYDNLGSLVYETNLMEVVTDSDVFYISNNYERSQLENYLSASRGSATPTKIGNTITLSYNTPNSERTCLKVYLINSSGYSNLCVNCSTSVNGTLTYNAASGNRTIIAESIVQYNGYNYSLDQEQFSTIDNRNEGMRFFMGFMILLVLSCGAFIHLVVGLIGIIFGLVIVNLLELITLGWSGIVGVIIIAIIIIFGVKKKYG